jgi:hypothetical protein
MRQEEDEINTLTEDRNHSSIGNEIIRVNKLV